MKKIVFTGGGTAGHIYPIVALLPYFKNYDIHYIGTNGMEREIISKCKGVIYHEIPAVKLVRKLTLKNLLIPFKLLSSIKKTKKVLREISPNVIFSKGGYVAVPVVLAGRRLGIPVVSHESDLSMGLANKIILKKCNAMCTTFLETTKVRPKCIHTGQPIRQDILDGIACNIKNKFTNNNPVLLIIGGSLGARFINQKITENIDRLLQDFNVIHITGRGNLSEIERENYIQIEFAERIADYYACADIVVSRAGSGVINELLYLRKPMLLIPLSKKCSRGDQIENANLFKKLKYAEVIEEEQWTNQLFFNKLNYLVKNKENIKQIMRQSAPNNANEKIVEIIEKYAQRNN